jgi:uncharacterized membrane protein YvlD (DUF360 family)
MEERRLSHDGVRNIGRRVVVIWIFNATALAIMARLLAGFELNSFANALVLGAILGALNALVWPLIMRLALPVTVLTLGFGSLVLNGLFTVWAVEILPENSQVHINSWTTGVIVAFGVSILSSVLTRLLAIDDDDFYYRNVVKRQAKRQKYRSSDQSKREGIIFLEIDGLAHEVLIRAIRSGNTPNIARWLREGTHRLMRWECDWSSQTGAMQAGILHGNNWDMPSFRWYEKDNRKIIISNRPADAVEIERRHSDGKGLLHYDGASRANLLSGDAPHSSITMSTVLRKSQKTAIGHDYMAFFSNPYSAIRAIIMVISEIAREIYQQRTQARRDVQPRVHRGIFPYPLLRAFTNVLQREICISATLQDMYAGRPVIYSMFLGYDEVAHHSGTERPETLRELEKIDRAFGRLERALKDAPRHYQVVVLADHGQTQGATFKQRYGSTLEELIRKLAKTKTAISRTNDEARGHIKAASIEMRRLGGILSVFSKVFLRTKNQDITLSRADIAVMPSGALGTVSFINQKGRLSLEKINHLYPNLVNELVGHEGVGFILVRSEVDGDLVIGKNGTHYLKSSNIQGSDPLKGYGPNALAHVKRTSSFPHCPDLVINSTYWPETAEVAAFEELVGSHGAMGGPQQYPFIIFPAKFKSPRREVVGAENVHKLFRSWLVDLGWESYQL